METKTPSAFNSALRYGLILGLVCILYSLLLYSFNLMGNKALGFVSVIILLVGIFWGVKDYRDKKSGGFINFGKAFLVGFLTALVCSALSAVFTFVFFKYFDPEMVTKIMADAEQSMLDNNPNMSESDIETAMSFTRKFTNPPMMALMGFLTNLAFSAILALIVAAVLKKEDNSMKEY